MSAIALVTFNDIPAQEATRKYTWLGALALRSHRRYCDRYGYDIIDQVEIDRSRPACWAKIPAVLRALEDHAWVLWADSDTLISNAALRLESLCESGCDLIVQDQAAWWELIGLPNGDDRFPINSGVFLIKASDWSRRLLATAYAQERFVTGGAVWDGIGDQEALNACIRADPEARTHIGYAHRLQTAPRVFDPAALLIHFYGNHAACRIPDDECRVIFERWSAAVERGEPLPEDRARFHWCCIQRAGGSSDGPGWNNDHFLYTDDDLHASHNAGYADGRG